MMQAIDVIDAIGTWRRMRSIEGVRRLDIAWTDKAGRSIDVFVADQQIPKAVISATTRLAGTNQRIVAVGGVHRVSQDDLLEVVGAADAAGFFAGLGQSRQEHRRQYGDDGNDDQKLN